MSKAGLPKGRTAIPVTMRDGIILALERGAAIVLTPEGDFLRVTGVQAGWKVGQEVRFAWPEPASLGRFAASRRAAAWRRRTIFGAALAVAAFTLLVLAQGVLPALRPAPPPDVALPPPEVALPPPAPDGAAPPSAGPGAPGPQGSSAPPDSPDSPRPRGDQLLIVAYVTLDINPSVELGLDAGGRVVEVRALNDAGEEIALLADVEGQTAEAAIERLTNAAVERGYLSAAKQNAVVITAVPATDQHPAQQLVQRLERTLPAAARAVAERRQVPGQAIQIVGLRASAELRQAAERESVSVGRLMVVLEAKGRGLQMSVEEVRERPLGEVLRRAGGDPRQALGDLPRFAGSDDVRKQFERIQQELRRAREGGAKPERKPPRVIRLRPPRPPGRDEGDRRPPPSPLPGPPGTHPLPLPPGGLPGNAPGPGGGASEPPGDRAERLRRDIEREREEGRERDEERERDGEHKREGQKRRDEERRRSQDRRREEGGGGAKGREEAPTVA